MQMLPLNAHVSDVSICLKKVNCIQLCAKGAAPQGKSIVLGNCNSELMIELSSYAQAFYLRRQHGLFSRNCYSVVLCGFLWVWVFFFFFITV